MFLPTHTLLWSHKSHLLQSKVYTCKIFHTTSFQLMIKSIVSTHEIRITSTPPPLWPSHILMLTNPDLRCRLCRVSSTVASSEMSTKKSYNIIPLCIAVITVILWVRCQNTVHCHTQKIYLTMIWVIVRDLQPCKIVTYYGLWNDYMHVCVCVCVCVWPCLHQLQYKCNMFPAIIVALDQCWWPVI